MLGDLWNLKYLHSFKWSHLTEKVAYERRVREQKLRVEMMQARRENASYVQMIETGKKLDKIEERKRKREAEGTGVDKRNSKQDNHTTNDDKKKRRRKHHQTQPMDARFDKPTKSALLQSLV
jgi:ESF2/ABP1 family protein